MHSAKGKRCGSCGKYDHFQVCCGSRNVYHVQRFCGMRNIFFVSKVECPAPSVPATVVQTACTNQHLVQSVCHFKCKRGYYSIPDGVYDVTCDHTKKWDSKLSGCLGKLTVSLYIRCIHLCQQPTVYTIVRLTHNIYLMYKIC